MSDTEILIKREIHTSQGDLDEERELLKTGADHLILEGSEQKNWQFKWRQLWFGWVLLIFEYLFARHLYVDKTIITDLAEIQDAKLHPTRKSDISILDNSHMLVKIVSAILFFTLFAVALIVGVIGNVVWGSLLLLVSSLSPLLLIRIHESRRATVGRDIQIAEMIEEVAQGDGRIIAIVGDAHADRIVEALSSDFEVEVKPPVYGRLSRPHLREVIYPVIVSFSVLYVVYSGILAYVMFLL
jgi:hypothetical protein